MCRYMDILYLGCFTFIHKCIFSNSSKKDVHLPVYRIGAFIRGEEDAITYEVEIIKAIDSTQSVDQ